MALTKYVFWDFSDYGLTPKITNQVDPGFGLVKVGTLTEQAGGGFTDAGEGFLRTGFAAGTGPFCNDDIFCARLLFDTTQFQIKNIFCNGVTTLGTPLAIRLAYDGSLYIYSNNPTYNKYTTAKYKADGTLNDLRIVVNRTTQTVKITINGVSETISYNAYKEPSCPNISFGGATFGGVTDSPFIGNMYKAWYSDTEEGLEIEPKFLFKKVDDFFKYEKNTNSFINIGTSPTENDYKSYGVGTINNIIEKVNIEAMKPMLFLQSSESLNCKIEFKPSDCIIKGSGDIYLKLKEIKALKSFTLTATESGNGKIKTCFSVDSGITWKKFNTTDLSIENIDINDLKNSGNTVSEFNSMPTSVLEYILSNQKVRFAYSISKENFSDKAMVNDLSMKVDVWGHLTEYQNAEVRLRNGYSEIIISELGTYMVNYI